MNSISAQEIKRRGIGAVDSALEAGPVYVIKHNKARYVVLSEVNYRQMRSEPASARLEESQGALDTERTQRGAAGESVSEDRPAYGATREAEVQDLKLENIPSVLCERLEHSARVHRRSLEDEVIACLEKTLMSTPLDPEEFLVRLDRLHQELDVPPLTDELLVRARDEDRP